MGYFLSLLRSFLPGPFHRKHRRNSFFEFFVARIDLINPFPGSARASRAPFGALAKCPEKARIPAHFTRWLDAARRRIRHARARELPIYEMACKFLPPQLPILLLPCPFRSAFRVTVGAEPPDRLDPRRNINAYQVPIAFGSGAV
jgi:hypothetical protein